MGEINQSPIERELDYLYGNYYGKSALDKKIKKAEEILKKNEELEDERLKKIFDDENYNRLKAMDIKDMSFADVELYNEIKKGYLVQSTIEKDFSGNDDTPKAEGSLPDFDGLMDKIISACNSLIPDLKSRGVNVAPLPDGSKQGNVLKFLNHVIQSLKVQNSITEPEPSTELLEHSGNEMEMSKIHKSSGYTRRELLLTQKEIFKMLAELDRQ